MGGWFVNAPSPVSDLSTWGQVHHSTGYNLRWLQREAGRIKKKRISHSFLQMSGDRKKTKFLDVCSVTLQGEKKKRQAKRVTFLLKTSRGVPAPERCVAKTLGLSDSTLHPQEYVRGKGYQREMSGNPSQRSLTPHHHPCRTWAKMPGKVEELGSQPQPKPHPEWKKGSLLALLFLLLVQWRLTRFDMTHSVSQTGEEKQARQSRTFRWVKI